jgi:hypothetical protein
MADLDFMNSRRRYLTLVNETTWADFPETPTYYHVPVNEYNAFFKPENRQAEPMTGLMQKKHNSNIRGMVSGSLSCNLYGWKPSGYSTTIAQELLNWAFADVETDKPRSKSAEWAEGPNVANKRHLGLRVASATLQGSDDNNTIDFSAELMGKSEAGDSVVGDAQALPNDREKLAEFEFADTVFTLATVETAIKSFNLQIDRAMKVHYLGGRTPKLIAAIKTDIKLAVQVLKTADTYDIVRRTTGTTDYAATLAIKGAHNGTGTGGTSMAIATFTLPRLSFVSADENASNDDVQFQTLNFEVMKPDSSSAALSIAYTEA